MIPLTATIRATRLRAPSRSSGMPGTARIGPIETSGWDGAMTTTLAAARSTNHPTVMTERVKQCIAIIIKGHAAVGIFRQSVHIDERIMGISLSHCMHQSVISRVYEGFHRLADQRPQTLIKNSSAFG